MIGITEFELHIDQEQHGYVVSVRMIAENGLAAELITKHDGLVVHFNAEALREASLDPDDYGRSLTAMVFHDERLRRAFVSARSAALTSRSGGGAAGMLRVRLLLDRRSSFLQSLRWETLRDPEENDVVLSRSQRIVFSRYVRSADATSVTLPAPTTQLKAAVVVANPHDLPTYRLAPIDVERELELLGELAGMVPTAVLARGRAAMPTIEHLLEQVRQGAHILYIVCHGSMVDGEPYLWLERQDGSADRFAGSTFIRCLQEMAQRPLLIVLASCRSAGGDQEGEALVAIGPGLAEINIPAVIAMSGDMPQHTVQQLIPRFFRYLLSEERVVDKALATARFNLAADPAWWRPVLFQRVPDGRLYDDRDGRLTDTLETPSPRAYISDDQQLAAWCEANWPSARSWLTQKDNRLSALLRTRWGRTGLAQDIDDTLSTEPNLDRALDHVIALLDPQGYAQAPAVLESDVMALELGPISEQSRPHGRLLLSNPSRRYVEAVIDLPEGLQLSRANQLVSLLPRQSTEIEFTGVLPEWPALAQRELRSSIVIRSGSRSIDLPVRFELQTPDGTQLAWGDLAGLADWCLHHWPEALEWLNRFALPRQIALAWRNRELAAKVRDIILAEGVEGRNQAAILQPILELLDPERFQPARPRIALQPETINLDALGKGASLFVESDIEAPRFIERLTLQAPRWLKVVVDGVENPAEISLYPGERRRLQLSRVPNLPIGERQLTFNWNGNTLGALDIREGIAPPGDTSVAYTSAEQEKLVQWCVSHRERAREWLYGIPEGKRNRTLADDILSIWGNSYRELGKKLKDIANSNRQHKERGLDEALCLLSPSVFALEPPRFAAQPDPLDFGDSAVLDVALTNVGNRHARIKVELPAGLSRPQPQQRRVFNFPLGTPDETIELAPGGREAIQVIATAEARERAARVRLLGAAKGELLAEIPVRGRLPIPDGLTTVGYRQRSDLIAWAARNWGRAVKWLTADPLGSRLADVIAVTWADRQLAEQVRAVAVRHSADPNLALDLALAAIDQGYAQLEPQVSPDRRRISFGRAQRSRSATLTLTNTGQRLARVRFEAPDWSPVRLRDSSTTIQSDALLDIVPGQSLFLELTSNADSARQGNLLVFKGGHEIAAIGLSIGIPLPDGSGVALTADELAGWAQAQWPTAREWLYRSSSGATLADEIETVWGDHRLADDLRAIAASEADQFVGTDKALTRIQPSGYGQRTPALALEKRDVYLGELSRNSSQLRLAIRETGGRAADVAVEAPEWLNVEQTRLNIAPGGAVALAITTAAPNVRVWNKGEVSGSLVLRPAGGEPVRLSIHARKKPLVRYPGRWAAALFTIVVLAALGVNRFNAYQSQQLANAQRYELGIAAIASNDFEAARREFAAVSSFRDAESRIAETYYLPGKAALEAGEYERARGLLREAGEHKDAPALYAETFYRPGKLALESEDYRAARTLLAEAGDYRDAPALLSESYYRPGKAALEDGDFETARSLLAEAGDYRDAPDLIRESYYRAGLEALAAGNYEVARAELERSAGFADSQTLIRESYFLPVRAALAGDRIDEAARLLLELEAMDPAFPGLADAQASPPELRQALAAIRWQNGTVAQLQEVTELGGETWAAFEASPEQRLLLRAVSAQPGFFFFRRPQLSAHRWQLDPSFAITPEPAGSQEPAQNVTQVAFLPGDGYIIAGDGGQVSLWQADRPEPARTFEGMSGRVSAVAVSAPGGLVAATGEGQVRVWRAADGALTTELTDLAGAAQALAVSPDEQLVAAGSSSELRLWRTRDGALTQLVAELPGAKTSLAFSPDNLTLAVGADDGSLRIIQVSDGTLLQTLALHDAPITTIAFTPDGQSLVAGDERGALQIWRTSDGKVMQELPAHAEAIRSIAFNADGRSLVTSSSDGVLRLWHTPAVQLAKLPLASLIDQPLGNIPIELEQRYYTPAREAIVAGRVAEAAQVILQIEADRPQDPQIGRLVASSPETARAIGALRWQSQRVRLIKSVEGLRGEPAVAFARLSSRLLTAVYDGGVPLIGPRRLVAAAYQIDTSLSALGDPAVEIAVDAPIGHIAFSADGQLVATAEEDGAVRIRRSGDGSVFRTVGGEEEGLLVSAFSPDGQTLITGGADGLVRVWRVDSGELQLSLPAHEGAATAVAFSLDGQSFASAGVDGIVRLWRAGDGQALQVFEGHTGPVASLAFSPDTLSLASGGADRTVRLWRTDGGRLEVLEGHLGLVSGLTFSPDGQTVASGSQDGTVRLWRVADGADLQTLSDQTGAVTRLAFSDDGRVLAVGDDSKVVRLYQAPAAVLSDPALQRVVDQPAMQVVAAPTPAAAYTGRVVNVGTLSLRVRAEPSREAAIAGRLQQNADVTIIDTRQVEDEQWLLIEASGTRGWVLDAYIERR